MFGGFGSGVLSLGFRLTPRNLHPQHESIDPYGLNSISVHTYLSTYMYIYLDILPAKSQGVGFRGLWC